MAAARHKTEAGERLRAMLPDGTDPYLTIDLAGHVAFLARDRQLLPGLLDVVNTMPELTAGLIVALAAMVDIDARPGDLIDWLGTAEDRRRETTRMIGALAEARQEYDDATADTLPGVTLESMRAAAHAANLAGVLHPCGTNGAYAREKAAGKDACPRCERAHALWLHASPQERALLKTPLTAQGGRRVVAVCGTAAGYEAHVKAGEDPCPVCQKAIDGMLAALVPPPAAPCGTVAGYDAHTKHGQKRCRICRDAIAVVLADVPVFPPKKRPSCGSCPGYNAHARRREIACGPCSEARAKYDAEQYRKRQAQRRRKMKKPPIRRRSCGSHAGYVAHGHVGERACDDCALAQRQYDAARHNRQAAQNSKPTAAPAVDLGQQMHWPESFVQDLALTRVA